MDSYLKKILNATVYDVAIETPLDEMPALSDQYGCRFLLKREDLQPVHSYKIRGAYNKMSQMPRSELEKGVREALAPGRAEESAKQGERARLAALRGRRRIRLAVGGRHDAAGVGDGAALDAVHLTLPESGVPTAPPHTAPSRPKATSKRSTSSPAATRLSARTSWRAGCTSRGAISHSPAGWKRRAIGKASSPSARGSTTR